MSSLVARPAVPFSDDALCLPHSASPKATAAMAHKPTILWVHGSWHTPNHFQRVIEVFDKAGYESVCPRQPSVGNLPPVGLKEDAQCIRESLERLVEKEDKDVLVVAHSYGGMVSNEGIDARFARAVRAKEGKKGGVVRIVFLVAFLVSKGTALTGPLGGALPPFIPIDEQDTCIMEDPQGRFYHDLPKDEQDHWAGEMLKSPASTQTTPLTQDVYASHPVAYIYCSEDQGLPLPAQQMMVKAIGDQYGITIATDLLKASHSPYLSMPDQVLSAIDRQVAAAAAS